MAPLKVIIVGAGIGCLAAAIGLTRNGHQVTVYERLSSTTEIGYALRITANSDRCLKFLGIDIIAGGAVAANSTRMFNAQGEVAFNFKENSGVGKADRETSVFAYRVFCFDNPPNSIDLSDSTTAANTSAVDAGSARKRCKCEFRC